MDKNIGVEISGDESVAVITFSAASISDVEQISAISEHIDEFVEQKHPKKIVFDFGQVKFFSSQVLGILLNARTKVKSYEGKVVISGINPQLYRVFKITNLDKIFKFFPDKDSALRAIEVDKI